MSRTLMFPMGHSRMLPIRTVVDTEEEGLWWSPYDPRHYFIPGPAVDKCTRFEISMFAYFYSPLFKAFDNTNKETLKIYIRVASECAVKLERRTICPRLFYSASLNA